MSLASYELAYSTIFGSSMLGLIFGYLNYCSVNKKNLLKLNLKYRSSQLMSLQKENQN